MKIYDYPSAAAEKKLAAIVNRGAVTRKKDLSAVGGIIEAVRVNGDRALIQYVNQFDAPGLKVHSLKVTPAEIDAAVKQVSRPFVRALNRAFKQIESFHQEQVTRSWIQTRRPGTFLGQVVNPVDCTGIYVPGGQGGQTPLVSSLLMGAIPAKIAGVKRLAVVTPPTRDGSVNPHILVAARKAGVDEIYKIGSAWAIAALAYGTETIPKADVIVGPGNIYVTLAKKILSGTVGIDIIAGPSEILVIADDSGIPAYIAADLLSQAEHDALASAVLVTPSGKIADAVALAIERQLETLDRREIAEKSLAAFGAIMVVPDLETALELANRIAPEHLELQVDNPFEHVGRVRNAGAVFMGHYTPEAVGDYVAGPNHVLPTAGTSRFASALSVDNFVKKTSLVYYSRDAFRREAADIMALAKIEGLGAHANSVNIRLKS